MISFTYEIKTENSIRKQAHIYKELASLVAQLVKNPHAMWETWIRSLGWEDALEKGKATHSSIQAWRSPWGRKESDTTEQVFHFHLENTEQSYI